jgi:hypothetical protein
LPAYQLAAPATSETFALALLDNKEQRCVQRMVVIVFPQVLSSANNEKLTHRDVLISNHGCLEEFHIHLDQISIHLETHLDADSSTRRVGSADSRSMVHNVSKHMLGLLGLKGWSVAFLFVFEGAKHFGIREAICFSILIWGAGVLAGCRTREE